jgi:alpha-1,3-rhamnosyl/mannosyltransferase
MVEALASQLSGIGRYSWELAQRLQDEPSITQLLYRVPGHWIEDPSDLIAGRSLPRQPWWRRKTPRALLNWYDRRTLASTIVHGPNYFLPPEADAGVITVHDLSVFKYPETHPAARIAQFERLFRSSLDRALRIITDTATIRDELVEFTGISTEQIAVVPLGVSHTFHPRDVDSLRPFLSRFGLEPGYGMCVSTMEPRKRIDCLIRAWSELPRTLRDTTPLILCGAKGWLNDELHSLIERGQAEGWLRFLDFVAETDLPGLYAGAGLFVYPSIYEGFGLPPIEAMASGVPTVTSDASCLLEVCGGAALHVAPEELGAFTRTIERGLTDHRWRAGAVAAGLARAGSLDWQQCVNRTVDVYKTL